MFLFIYKKLINLFYYFKHRYIYYYILRFTKNKKLYTKQPLLKIKQLYYIFSIINYFFFKKQKKVTVNINSNYLLKYYTVLNKKIVSTYYLKNNNVFFFWYFFNNDPLIQIFLNLFMKKGKKYVCYKQIYNIFFFIKKLIGIQPLMILKKSLFKNRLLFDVQYLKLRKRIITIPKVLTTKSQISKSIKCLLNNYNLKKLKLKKQKTFLSYYKKISFLLLNNLFFKNRLKQLILKESYLVKNNFNHISKKYLISKKEESKELLKVSLFKKKFKSFSKKDKLLKEKNKKIYFFKQGLLKKKKLLFSRYQLNILSKLKLKTKWF